MGEESRVSLFRLDASTRVDGSHSRAIADIVEQQWRDAHPGDLIVRRHVGVEPIPATAWATAVFAGRTPAQERTEEHNGALALAATLTDALVGPDALVVATPLYNFGVSRRLHQGGAAYRLAIRDLFDASRPTPPTGATPEGRRRHLPSTCASRFT